LHALPEHLAHGNASKLQFEIVAVLALLALFTHNTWFWVAALLLALVPIPDIYAPLAGMAESLAKMARWGRPRTEAPGGTPREIAWTMPSAAGAGVKLELAGRADNGLDDELHPGRAGGEPLPEKTASNRPHAEVKERHES
jgi:hypothetical protein